ncbi:MAG: hypothetical protein K2J01_06245 [Clostridiales bacterium]|nr:hypothetical protein [Clostridiales bacterium]
MEREDCEQIESLIGYEFNRRDLLVQAFTRKSYTNETHDGDNNEVLEFIGDQALGVAVVRALSDYYGEINGRDEFSCELTEGKLSDLKKSLVECSMLAHRIDVLDFSQYLIMGKGDRKLNVSEDPHVKEDLFEAIVGAVAIDSDWDYDAIQDTVELMLDLDYYLEHGVDDSENYVTLVQEWSQKKKNEVPRYEYQDTDEYKVNRMIQLYSIYGQRDTIENEDSDGPITCKLYIDDGNPFVGFGYSKSKARMAAAEAAYEYLEYEGMLFTMEDEIDEPSEERAINQLQELAQKGYFSLPEYTFEEKHDRDGNPYWWCRCVVRDYIYWYQSKASTKKEAKRRAAYNMLMSILNANGKENDNDWYDNPDDDDWDD